jgi:probable biosynthetic protein (TIGR04099 family)
MPSVPSPILIGMPQLSHGGLSENWLLKECGHRHWLALAAKLGLASPDFRDAGGNRLYAAFTAVRLSEARLQDVKENDRLSILTSLGRVSRTQHSSTHSVMSRARRVAKVEMASAFLRRAVASSNRHVERGDAVMAPNPPDAMATWTSDLAADAHLLRSDRWREHLGFRHGEASALETFVFQPCPHGDFNGADFLYFASFQSVVDRAEWSWWAWTDVIARTRRRDLFYYGNADLGERLEIMLCAKRGGGVADDAEFRHWCRIYRKSDQKLIADVFTLKRFETRAHIDIGHSQAVARPAVATEA